jgi:hypothetical protein
VTQASWLIFNRRVPPLDQAEVRLGLAQSGRARAFDLLARAGLPDGFDLVVWNAASVPVTGLPFEQLGIIPVSVVPVTEVELSWGLTGSESFRPAGERADLPGSLPGALGVTWTRDWERQWWLALAGWDAGAEPASEADRMGVPLSGAGGSVIYRRGLAGLGVTSGGWPRITAQTVLP